MILIYKGEIFILPLNKQERETILMMPEDNTFAVLSTYHPDLKAVLEDFSREFPHFCQHRYHTEEGRDTYTILASCITMLFAPAKCTAPCPISPDCAM